jgi:hypothetical protein
MTIPAYPLSWPQGWKRTPDHRRERARFGRKTQSSQGSWQTRTALTITQAVDRVRAELSRMGVSEDDLVISTNLVLRLDGFPRSGQAEPKDPGVAVYWKRRHERDAPAKCMAIDRYDRVADNLAAIAATLDAMRAIERHGGAAILDRAFTGFAAIEPPAGKHWSQVLGVPRDASTSEAREAFRRARSLHHPDNGGDAEAFKAVMDAWDACCREHQIQE